MKNFEIGSEYWYTDGFDVGGSPWDEWYGEKRTFLSGRTALSSIIDDILIERQCKTAYLPSYCCHSMIEPFLAHNISVAFYSVVFEDGSLVQRIDPEAQYDIVLTLDYFGFAGQAWKMPSDSVVIRDMTHSLFAQPERADYLFASLRKWGAIAGAAVACKAHTWRTEIPTDVNNVFIALRQEGYERKSRFMAGETENKGYLKIFNEAEVLLDHDYQGYAADKDSLDAASCLKNYGQIRRSNAQQLLDGLKGMDFLQPMFSTLGEKDIPLFVPILVKNGKRDQLRTYMIQHAIYCPVHWPMSSYHVVTKECETLYNDEISIVCDQRYDENDMQRIIEVIRKFERE